jgi:hypothetical protein
MKLETRFETRSVTVLVAGFCLLCIVAASALKYHEYQEWQHNVKLAVIESNQSKTICAQHIGKLKGEKWKIASAWFKPFDSEEYLMSDEDLKACLAF